MFSIDDVIENQLNPNETQFDISNKEENEINLYKISKKEKEILNELSNQRIFNLYQRIQDIFLVKHLLNIIGNLY